MPPAAHADRLGEVATGSGAAHPFVIPLTKIDVERRLVIGTAAEEIADKSREIMDYVTARPQFEEWSNGFSTATNGLSKGNLRVMHTKTVAGRLDAIDYDDVSKKVQIVAKVSDDNEWKKCLDGAYTGFSIGGGYLRKWKDPDTGLTRYTPIVREISLVDNPCMPSATFAELVKADGVVEQIELHGVLRGFAESWEQRPVGFAEAWGNGPAELPPTFGALFKRKIPKRVQGQAVELPRDWSESKHPRGQGGKFTSGTDTSLKTTDAERLSPADRELEPLKQAEWEAEHGREKRVNVVGAMAEGASGAAYLATRGPTTVRNLVRMARFGVGEKGERNATAQALRGNRTMRSAMVRSARSAGQRRLADFSEEQEGPGIAAAKARRKLMQEAGDRGSSKAAAEAEADRFAAILARRGPKTKKGVPIYFKDGVGARFASPRAAGAAARAVKQDLRGSVLRAKHAYGMAGNGGRKAGKFALLRTLAIGGLAGSAGGALGAQAAYRLQREQEDHGITGAHHVGATAGDLARALNGTGLAEFAGGVAGLGASLHRQGFRLGSRASMAAGLASLNQRRALRAGLYGSLVGAGLNFARNVPTLAREYGGRVLASKED